VSQTTTGPLQETYEPILRAARARFAQCHAAGVLADPQLDATFLTLFLIHFNSLGVALTRPVENWLVRSSRSCADIGLAELAKALLGHSKAEAGHDQMMVRDTHALVAHWNTTRSPALDAEALLRRPPTPGGRNYQQLHEETIAGPAPFAQIAIEYEIEMLPVQFGPLLLEQCRRVLGPDILKSLSFLDEHIALDVGHTRFNALHLEKLLQWHPEFLGPLVNAGEAALEAYQTFLADCVQVTRDHLAELPEVSALSA
jgi:hypothetical protein